MKKHKEDKKALLQSGSALLVFIIVLMLILGIIVGADYGYISYLENCGDTPIGECVTNTDTEKEVSSETEKEDTIITAKGTFTKNKYSAVITMSFPSNGGSVSGSVEGDCKGSVEGTYEGGDGGSISGKIFGSCSPFFVPIPATGTFSGSVNQTTKIVPITGTGSAAGFSGTGSLTLTY